MIRLVLFLLFFCFVHPRTYGQFTVRQDEKGQLMTTYETYSPNVNSGARTLTNFRGSPFLTFPIWQKGSMQLDKYGKAVDCELAYNLVTNQVLCRFPGDSAVKIITPETFTVGGIEFTKQQNHLLPYTTPLSNGPTKLLQGLSRRIGVDNRVDSYRKDITFIGSYITRTDYYIQKGKAQPELINLTKSSVLGILYEQASKMAAILPAKAITTDEVVKALRYYDSLMTIDQVNKLPLLVDPVFTQTIHDKIGYPNYARSLGVYGRVYAGFDINEKGQIKNIAILSPDNGGFRFDIMVRDALEKLPPVDPVCRGSYVLPVAFTYTNTKDQTNPNVPINRLPDERLGGRTLLEEFVVNAVGPKPESGNKEIWGYFK